MQVIPDPILSFWMALPFLVTFLGLYFILFKPLIQYLSERDAAASTARDEAASLASEIESRLSLLDEKLEQAREEIADLRAEARAKANQREGAIIAEARAEADQRIKQAIARIAAERDEAARVLRESAGTISQDIASQVLGRPVQP